MSEQADARSAEPTAAAIAGDATSGVATSAPAAQAPVAPRPAAATWQSRPVEGPWCPEPLRAVLPWAARVAYVDVISEEGRAGSPAQPWHVLAISQRGRVHAHAGSHREDAVSLVCGSRGFALAAADGAGSSRWSRVGASCVCRHVAASARVLLDTSERMSADQVGAALVDAVARASDELRDAATASGGDARDFRTTVLAAVCLDGFVVTVQVGDGAIVARGLDGSVRRLGATDSGMYSGEVSAFLPEVDRAGLVQRVATTSSDELAAILVVTDGIEDPFYPIERHGSVIFRQLSDGVQAPIAEFSAQRAHGPVIDHPEALRRLEDWMAFERRGENDDRTLAGAFRLAAAER